MSLAELKKQAEALAAHERLELAAHLAELEEQSEPEFRRAVDERMKEMDGGSKISGAEFEAEHLRRGKR